LFNQVSNRTVEFSLLTGAVISSQKHSETHVSSSGGGGYLHKGSGYVSAPVVTSRIVTKHEFWIRKEDGQDVPVNLTNANVSVAEGQTVSLVLASVSGLEGAPPVLIINHNAKGHWFIPPSTAFINAMHEPMKLWPVIVTVVLLFMGFGWWVFGLAGLGFGFYRLFRRRALVKASTARLGQHVGSIAQSVYSGAALPAIALPALPPLAKE
jgi:hypothetical protein